MKSTAKKATKVKYCAQPECKEKAQSQGFCRLHYIANWKQLKADKKDRAEKRLNAYVDRLAKKYPSDYMERIKEGLEDEEKFKASVAELDLESDEENSETEREFLEKFLRSMKDE
jgi:hypothetical protein